MRDALPSAAVEWQAMIDLPPRKAYATHEVELAPRGAVLVAEQVLGVDGTGQVDLQGGVDGDDIVVLGEDVRVVDILPRQGSRSGSPA